MKSIEVEYWYDNQTLFHGFVELKKDSISNEFGSVPVSSLDIQQFQIIFYIREMDHDVTKHFQKNEPATYKLWKREFEQIVWEKHVAELVSRESLDEGA